MYKFTMFNSFRNSISGKWLQSLKDIIEHSKDLELNYNQRQTALGYFTKNIIPKLEKIEEKKDHFTIDQFREILQTVPSWAMPKDQIEKLKIIARGGSIPKPKIEPEKKEKSEEQKGVEESEPQEDLFSTRSLDEEDYDRALLIDDQENQKAKDEDADNQRRAAAAAAAAKEWREKREKATNEEIYKMGEDI